MDPNIIQSYEEWKACIESATGRLTLDFVAERIRALSDLSNDCTRKFVETYGDAHRRRVIQWLEKEKNTLAENA